MPTIACLIRCKDSARTLPGVLASLRAQTRQPDFIVAVDNGSTDDTPRLLAEAGALILPWTEKYSHPCVLNFGIQHSPPTDFILVVSSHTALADRHTIERMATALESHPQAAGVSPKWDTDPFYSDHITHAEVQAKGMRLCSIYTNSLGMIRRAHWLIAPFDETLPTAEDYEWSLCQLAHGHTILRLTLPFNYQRQGYSRVYEFTHTIFRIAAKHQQRVIWLGPKGTARLIAEKALAWLLRPAHRPDTRLQLHEHWAKLRAWSQAGSM